VHSRHYTNGARCVGKDVAVVGSGNSAAEICVDLVEHGASSVTMVVTGPRHFLDLRKLSWVHRIEQALTE
jgi:cation diffusion facilitator CzcD-associated flavoprotein CzcO